MTCAAAGSGRARVLVAASNGSLGVPGDGAVEVEHLVPFGELLVPG
jgi:hypothetical protein